MWFKLQHTFQISALLGITALALSPFFGMNSALAWVIGENDLLPKKISESFGITKACLLKDFVAQS